jgi:hypothetical protein
MRYDDTHGFVSLDGEELRGGALDAGATLSPVAPAPLGHGSEADREAWRRGLAQLPDVARERATKAVVRLAAPARVVEMHAASALGPHHLYFAFPESSGRVAVLGVTSGAYSLALRTGGDLAASLQGALGLDAAFVGSDLVRPLDPHAVLALAAFLDVLRANRLLAELRHERPLESATAADVAARVADARTNDPRWPLCALEKVLPFDVTAVAQEETVAASLGRLVAAGLLEAAEATGALPALFSPGPDLAPLVEECSRAVAHVALSTFRPAADGTLGYESALLLRGPVSLWLLSLAPEGGGIASLSPAGASRLVARVSGNGSTAGAPGSQPS